MLSGEFGTLADWAAVIVVGLLSLGGSAIGYGMNRQKVNDLAKAREEDRQAHREDIQRIEAKADAAATMAGDVKAIPASIEGMGVRLATQIEHVVEMFGLRFQHLDEKVDGLETQVRKPKRPRAPAHKGPKP